MNFCVIIFKRLVKQERMMSKFKQIYGCRVAV